MKPAARLKLYTILKLYKGEEKKTAAFLILQGLISVTIGIFSSGIDSLFLIHPLDKGENALIRFFSLAPGILPQNYTPSHLAPFLIGSGAFLLLLIGLSYAGLTDKIDKKTLFKSGTGLIGIICILSSFMLFYDRYIGQISYLYSGLYIGRFVIGVLLLILFWDFSNMYFDIRQGKRLFPYLAIGGAVGYAFGSIIVAPISAFLNFAFLLLITAILLFISLYVLIWIDNNFSPIYERNYKTTGFVQEIKDGIHCIVSNPFLRVLGFSTLIFGILSGLIMFAYNDILNSNITSNTTTTRIIAFQRAIATIIEAFVITKLLSISGYGNKMKSGIFIQAAALIIGILSLFIVMVGVADFTRQIAAALMAPGAMASFTIIPSRFRGRALVLNNMVIASAGMVTAGILLVAFESFLNIRNLLIAIAVLILFRFLLNWRSNQKFLSLLSNSLDKQNRLDAASFENNIDRLFSNKNLLTRFLKASESEDSSTRFFLWKTLAEKVSSSEEIRFLEPYRPDKNDPAYTKWLEMIGEHAFVTFENEIRQAGVAPQRRLRITARIVQLLHFKKTDNTEHYNSLIEQICNDIDRALLMGRTELIIEKIEILLRTDTASLQSILKKVLYTMEENEVRQLLELLTYYPQPGIETFLIKNIDLHYYAKEMISLLDNKNEIEDTFFTYMYEYFSKSDKIFTIIESLSKKANPEVQNFLKIEFNNVLSSFIKNTPNNIYSEWKESQKRQYHWASFYNKKLLSLALSMLENNIHINSSMQHNLELAIQEIRKTAACLYTCIHHKKDNNQYYHLITKITNEEINILLSLLLALEGLLSSTIHQKELIHRVIREMQWEIRLIDDKSLELIENIISRASFRLFNTMIVNITKEEKLLRLKLFTKYFQLSFPKLLTVWIEGMSESDSSVKNHLIKYYKNKV